MTPLSLNLQYLMKKQNINQKTLANMLGIPAMSVGRWIEGKITDPTVSKLITLSTKLKIPIDDLLFNSIELKETIKTLYQGYISIPEYESVIPLDNNIFSKYKSIPQILIPHVELEDYKSLFIYKTGEDYSHIYPNYYSLVFTRKVNTSTNNMFVVQHQILKNILLVKLENGITTSVLTNERIEISQYNLLGSLTAILVDKYFLGIEYE